MSFKNKLGLIIESIFTGAVKTYISSLSLISGIMMFIVSGGFFVFLIYCMVFYVPDTLHKMQNNDFENIQWFPAAIGVLMCIGVVNVFIDFFEWIKKRRRTK